MNYYYLVEQTCVYIYIYIYMYIYKYFIRVECIVNCFIPGMVAKIMIFSDKCRR